MFNKAVRSFALFHGCLLLFATAARSQTAQPPPNTSPKPAAATAKLSPIEAKVKRWFEFDQLIAATRYHFIENENRRKPANNVQYQFVAGWRFKFDPKGKYSIAGQLATGVAFTTFWNATGAGTGKFQDQINLRRLYFDAKPRKEVEVQVGGFHHNYGETTEAISYDADGYMTGERVQLRAPKYLYFDEVSVTYGTLLLSDLTRMNVFSRFHHFDKQNYHQFLVRKQFTKYARFSADYTFQSGIDTLHEAVRFKIPRKHGVDNILFEQYQRLDPDKDYGFNIFADRQLNKTFNVGGGFARVNIVPPLNSDRFPPGKRFYFNGLMKLSPEFGLLLQVTQGVGFLRPTVARTRVDVTVTYNIFETLRRTKFF